MTMQTELSDRTDGLRGCGPREPASLVAAPLRRRPGNDLRRGTMSKIRTYSRNVLASWAGYGANMAVMFFLTPFVVHGLGPKAYGVWALLVSVTGYLGLVELGVRGSTGRFVNFHIGRGDDEKVNRIISTSLLFYTTLSVVVLGVSTGLGLAFGHLFTKVPDEFARQAMWILPLLGINVWLGFFSATFNQLLCARDRFDLRSVVDLLVLAVRSAGTVWVLSDGGGLVALATVQVASGAVGCAGMFVLARWKGYGVQIARRYVDRATFREVFGYGLWATVGHVGIKLIYYTDAAVIGLLLGAEEVALYSVGFMLIEYGRQVVGHVVHVVSPDIHKASGREDFAALHRHAISGTRSIMFVAVPLLVGLMVLGEEFIHLWMWPAYAQSAAVLSILAVAQFGALAARPCGSILGGLGHVKFLGLLAIAESLCNLLLSVLLIVVAGMGILGVAFGTTIPMVLLTSLLMPLYACRAIRLGFWRFHAATTARWLVATSVFACIALLARNLLPTGEWGHFWLKVAILGCAYVPVGGWIILGQTERGAVRRTLRRRRVAPAQTEPAVRAA